MNISIKRILLLFLMINTTNVLFAMHAEQNNQQEQAVGKYWLELRDMIIQRPCFSLLHAHGAKTKGLEFGGSREEALQNSLKECPFFMVSECMNLNCPLHRTPEGDCLRNHFEEEISRKLIEFIDTLHAEPIHYVSFACGRLFSDFRMLTLVLNSRPKASIVVNLIDPLVMSIDGAFEISDSLIQMKHCLSNMFPDAIIEFKCYADWNAYDKDKTCFPSIVMTTDNDSPEGQREYRLFVHAMLKQNSEISNFSLEPNQRSKGIIVTTKFFGGRYLRQEMVLKVIPTGVA